MGNQTGGVMQNKMWMVGMMLIAFFVGMMFSQNTTAQQSEIGRYQMAAVAVRLGTGVILYRLNTATGETILCGHSETPTGGRIRWNIVRECGS
jgi:hypothetical protein